MRQGREQAGSSPGTVEGSVATWLCCNGKQGGTPELACDPVIPFLAYEPPGAGPLSSSLPLPTSLASLLINIESGRCFEIEGQCPSPSPSLESHAPSPSPRVPLTRLCLILGDTLPLLPAAVSSHLSALSGATGPPKGWHPFLLLGEGSLLPSGR